MITIENLLLLLASFCPANTNCDSINEKASLNAVNSSVISLNTGGINSIMTDDTDFYITSNGKVIYQCDLFSNPYKGKMDEVKLFYKGDSDLYFFIYENNIIKCLNDSSFFIDTALINYLNRENYNDNYYPFNAIELLNSSVSKINNYSYFTNLSTKHLINDSGICGVVSSDILLGYYDIFENDQIIQEEYDCISISDSFSNNWTSWYSSPGTTKINGLLKTQDCFGAYLYNNYGLYFDGMYLSDVTNLLTNYLTGLNIVHSYSTNLLYYPGANFNNLKSFIQNAINNNSPLICKTSDHFVVAFAYSEDYVYVHTGWGWCAKTPWSTFLPHTSLDTTGAVKISFPTHIHSNNFYSKQTHKYICPCGAYFSSINLPITTYTYSNEQYYGLIPGTNNFFLYSLNNCYVSGTSIYFPSSEDDSSDFHFYSSQKINSIYMVLYIEPFYNLDLNILYKQDIYTYYNGPLGNLITLTSGYNYLCFNIKESIDYRIYFHIANFDGLSISLTQFRICIDSNHF